MYKLLALVSRRADMSPEKFRDYYERVHVPLVLEHIRDTAVSYSRNYVATAMTSADGKPGDTGPAVDCIMEIKLTDKAGLDGLLARIGVADVARKFAQDEENFIDRTASRIFICEHHENQLASG